MQEALTQMNVQFQHVINNITGLTGLVIIDAILAGERDPAVLAKLRDPHIKANEETIRKPLEGNWLRRSREITLLCSPKVIQQHRQVSSLLPTGKVVLPAGKRCSRPFRNTGRGDGTRLGPDGAKQIQRLTRLRPW